MANQTILSTAPLMAPFRVEGSTFYTFSSTLNDMSLTLGDGVDIKPSKFALLKLPNWSNLSGVQQMFRPSADFGPVTTTDPNTLIPKMIQNYMENYLQFSPSYVQNAGLQNSSEQIFWKMLNTLGAIRFKVDHMETENGVEKPVFVEDTAALTDYEPVVKYVGDITAINSIAKGGRAYTEVYAYVPTEQGAVTGLTWYGMGATHSEVSIPSDPGPDTTVGLDDYPDKQVKAIYDTVDKKYSTGGDQDNLNLWFEDIQSDPTRYLKDDFDFNAVLLYYDIWSVKDPTNRKRNLYGILFLDKFEDIGSSKFAIPTYTKYQPDENKDGNAFGFRMNLTFSNATNQVVAETAINDYDTISMELYLDALRRLNVVTDEYQAANKSLTYLTQTIENIKSKLALFPTFDAIIAQQNQNTKDIKLLNQSYRVTNDELFAMFQTAVTQVSTANSVTIQQVVGNYIWIDDEVYVISPDGKRWKYNSATSLWELVVT